MTWILAARNLLTLPGTLLLALAAALRLLALALSFDLRDALPLRLGQQLENALAPLPARLVPAVQDLGADLADRHLLPRRQVLELAPGKHDPRGPPPRRRFLLILRCAGRG